MSLGHLWIALCVGFSTVTFSQAAFANDPSIELAAVGKSEASDVDFKTTHDSDTNHPCNDDHDCDCGNDCDCPPLWHWAGGVEATYLDPRFHASGNPQADTALSRVDPGWSAAPRIWLGAENTNGWGARVRYWQLADEESRFGINDIQPGALYDIAQTLKMYDIDAEATKRFELGDWNLLGSFGGRFASVERLVSANAFDTTPPADSFLFNFLNRTSGGGITGSIELSRPIGIGAWEVFGSFRGSQVWGDTNAVFLVRENNAGTPSSSFQALRFNSDLTIWETQVGLQCSKHLDWCNSTMFTRCAFEYQSWNWNVPGGNPGGGAIFDPGADLYGVAFAIGFTH